MYSDSRSQGLGIWRELRCGFEANRSRGYGRFATWPCDRAVFRKQAFVSPPEPSAPGRPRTGVSPRNGERGTEKDRTGKTIARPGHFSRGVLQGRQVGVKNEEQPPAAQTGGNIPTGPSCHSDRPSLSFRPAFPVIPTVVEESHSG